MFEPYILLPHALPVLTLAAAADLALGDRDHPIHPVRLMGAAISWAEKRARALLWKEFFAGLFMAVSLTVFTFLLVYGLGSLFLHLSLLLYLLFATICISYGLCLRCLADEALKVFRALDANDLPLARQRLSMLVSRETQGMDKVAVSRAVIETVSENFVDGVCSPWFYAVLGGPALCLSFKMVSTLDSMVGYRNKRYENLGKAAAKMDDAANFIPARLSVLFVALSGLICFGKGPFKTIKGTIRDARTQSSPNSGFPEAAFAHVLGVSLGGPALYQGVLRDHPLMNRQARPPGPIDIKRAIVLLYSSALIFYLAPIIIVALTF